MTERSGRNALVLAELLEHGDDDIFQRLKHIFLGCECHFHIHLVELAGGTVGTGILVTEAGCNLEVAVEAGGHQQLLELLGSLRQSVKLAGVVPGRHEIVTGALGRRRGEDGGSHLQEALLGHEPAQLCHHLTAQDDVGLHRRITQIQIAVLQTGILVSFPGLVDLKGQLVVAALAQHLDLGGNHFDLAGGDLGILALTLPDNAGDGDGGLLVDALDNAHHFLVINDDLSGAVEVTDDQEGKVGAHFTDVFQPAADGYILACITKPQLAAGMGSGLGHGKYPLCYL